METKHSHENVSAVSYIRLAIATHNYVHLAIKRIANGPITNYKIVLDKTKIIDSQFTFFFCLRFQIVKFIERV